MSTSSTGSRRSPQEPDPLQELSPLRQMHVMIDTITDCLQRALDGIRKDEGTPIDWVYVGGQLKAAGHFCNRGEILAELIIDDQDGDGIDTALMGMAPDLPIVLVQPAQGDEKGGAA